MKPDNFLRVYYEDRLVGRMAMSADHKAAFQYSDQWLEEGFSISPFSLPLESQVFLPEKVYFDGLFGVFADSLPDAWGQLLLKRFLSAHAIDMSAFNVLDRLSVVGKSGMGALTYEPEKSMSGLNHAADLDVLAEQCQKVLRTEYAEQLDELYRLGGTSGGARPKIMTEVDGEDWIIKFPAHIDGNDIGKMEYDYSCCAKKCGIEMSETRLFPSKNGSGYFGIKRFDRVHTESGVKKVHMLTAAALLELDFCQPSLDYHSLMKLTRILTRDNADEMNQMYRRMCFNVFAHNRDDHSKNFSYLYDEVGDCWRLSPAYDLTYSNTYYGEHTTTIDGIGRDPGMRDIIAVGIASGMKKGICQEIAEEIAEIVREMLAEYLKHGA